MPTHTLNVFPAYLGGYDPTVALTDWNEMQLPTLISTQDLGASAAYLVRPYPTPHCGVGGPQGVGDEPEAADEVFEKHIAWPDTCPAVQGRCVRCKC